MIEENILYLNENKIAAFKNKNIRESGHSFFSVYDTFIIIMLQWSQFNMVLKIILHYFYMRIITLEKKIFILKNSR